MSFSIPARVRIALALLLLTIGFAPAASAVQSQFTILLDLDNNPATGCSMSGYSGVEERVVTTVDTATIPSPSAMVIRIEGFDCSNAQTFVDTDPHTVGLGNGENDLNVVETFWKRDSTVDPLQQIRLRVLSENDNGGQGQLLTTDGTPSGPPIVFQFGSIAEVPTLSQWGLLLLVMLVALAAVTRLRSRRARGLLVVLLLLGMVGVVWAAASDLNGQTTGEWAASSRLAFDQNAVDNGSDISALWAMRDDGTGRVYFRIDASLVFTSPQTITFTSTPPANAAVGGAAYNVTATASSGLPVTFTIDPSATAVCSISGSTVSFIGNGTCVIDADQAGDANFDPAPQVQQSFGVKTAQTISFTSSPPATPTVGGATYTVTATATSGLAVTFTIDASASTVCSISGSTVSFIGNGTCVIDADQAGDANFYPAPQVQQSFGAKT
ncbi:MAG: IPTL-CTERM sorting domain-containing protein, partial [Thermoanaerobaculia bacterium]